MRSPFKLVALLAAAIATSLGAQAPTFQFTIDNIMRGPELFGRTTWYHVRATEGGGWVHSALVDYV